MKDFPLYEAGHDRADTVDFLYNRNTNTPPHFHRCIEILYILSGSVTRILKEKGVSIYRTFVGEYATSMEMAGASISICRMADQEMKEQIDMPVNTPFYCQK